MSEKAAAPEPSTGQVRASPYVPTWLHYGGAWGWRFAALAAALYVILRICSVLWVPVFAVVLGAITATLLEPLASLLGRARVPRSIAAAVSVLFALACVIGALVLFGARMAQELDQLGAAAQSGYHQLVDWTYEHSGISKDKIESYVDQHLGELQENAGTFARQLLKRARGIVEGLTVLGVMLVFAWFFVWDGEAQFSRAVEVLPPSQRPHARAMGDRIWRAVGGYMRGMLVIAAADAVLLGVGLWSIGMSLVLPLMLLMFVGAFVPFVGPLVTGLMAVLVAASHGGLSQVGLVMLVVVAVQQIEGNLLHPFIMGRAVSLHPAMILFAITAGGAVAGIAGIFLAIPAAASIASVAGYIREQQAATELVTQAA